MKVLLTILIALFIHMAAFAKPMKKFPSGMWQGPLTITTSEGKSYEMNLQIFSMGENTLTLSRTGDLPNLPEIQSLLQIDFAFKKTGFCYTYEEGAGTCKDNIVEIETSTSTNKSIHKSTKFIFEKNIIKFTRKTLTAGKQGEKFEVIENAILSRNIIE